MALSKKATALGKWLAMYKIAAADLSTRLTSNKAIQWFNTLASSGRRLSVPQPAQFKSQLAEIVAADTTAPTISSSLIADTAPNKIVLTYGEALNLNSVPPISAYSVTVNGTARAITALALASTTVTLTLASPVVPADTVVLNYVIPATNPVEDATGNHVVALTSRSITNNVVAPVVSSAAVANATPTQVKLTFAENLDATSVPAASAFVVHVNAGTGTISTVGISGAILTLTLSAPITTGQTVTVDYTKPGTGAVIQDAYGTAAASFSGRAVTNNV